jgi:hypothetical protein
LPGAPTAGPHPDPGSPTAELAGQDVTVGWFRLDGATGIWRCTPASAHPGRAGAAPPLTGTTAALRAVIHPADAARLLLFVGRVRATSEPLRTRFRIIDADGVVHHITAAATARGDHTGQLISVDGVYLDLVSAAPPMPALSDVVRDRATIEQAKGMLMLIYRLDADQAFAVLRECSQHGNIKLRILARQIVTDFRALPHPNGALAAPEVYTRLLRTAHLRAAPPITDEASHPPG